MIEFTETTQWILSRPWAVQVVVVLALAGLVTVLTMAATLLHTAIYH